MRWEARLGESCSGVRDNRGAVHQVPTVEWEDLEAARSDSSASSTLIREAVARLDQTHTYVSGHSAEARTHALQGKHVCVHAQVHAREKHARACCGTARTGSSR
jgi:hypothetical protein